MRRRSNRANAGARMSATAAQPTTSSATRIPDESPSQRSSAAAMMVHPMAIASATPTAFSSAYARLRATKDRTYTRIGLGTDSLIGGGSIAKQQNPPPKSFYYNPP